MMKARIFLFIMICLTIRADGQNLVQNGDFELFYGCPTAWSMIDSAQFWTNATTNGTPDYLHQCGNPLFAGVPLNAAGYQVPSSGEAYAGIYIFQGPNNYREFMGGQLATPLIAGGCYHFEMYLSLAHYFKHTASNFGVYFSNTPISGILGVQMQNFTPQIENTAGSYPDTTTWLQVSGSYTSTGGENFLIIGNFDVDAAIDSVLIHPNALWPGAYVYVDDISLTPCTGVLDPLQSKQIHVYPNPAKDYLMVKSLFSEPAEFILYNFALQEVKRLSCSKETAIDLTQIKPGIYFYKIKSDNLTYTGKFIKL